MPVCRAKKSLAERRTSAGLCEVVVSWSVRLGCAIDAESGELNESVQSRPAPQELQADELQVRIVVIDLASGLLAPVSREGVLFAATLAWSEPLTALVRSAHSRVSSSRSLWKATTRTPSLLLCLASPEGIHVCSHRCLPSSARGARAVASTCTCAGSRCGGKRGRVPRRSRSVGANAPNPFRARKRRY